MTTPAPEPTPVPSRLPIEDVMAKHRAQHAADAAATQPHRSAQAALPQAGERRKFPPLPGHPGQK